jgi:superfamily I DNA/RNA helicase
MEYSKYQLDLFKFVENEDGGNAIVKAVAGSGKTYSIIKSLDYIKDNKKILFLAFNVSTVDELKSKITKKNVDIKTTHSLGLQMLSTQIKNDNDFTEKNIFINKYKYKQILQNSWENILLKYDLKLKDKNDINNFQKIILELVDLCRSYLCKNTNEIHKIAEKYNYIINDNYSEIILHIIEKGCDLFYDTSEIDFSDMIYLPCSLGISTNDCKYDWVIIDEIQDQTTAMKNLVMKSIKKGGRFLGVGDEKQAIMGFSGANEESMNEWLKIPNTISLPLSINYRCPKIIEPLAKKFVPQFEVKDNAIEGKINKNVLIKDIKDNNSMVICRNTAPLIKLYLRLLRENRNCYIKGIDISNSILQTVNNIDLPYISLNLNQDGIIPYLYRELFKSRNKLIEKNGISLEDATNEKSILDQYEMINTIKILSEDINEKYELIDRIKKIFGDKSEDGICLITNHKAKGLEADYVYHLCPSLLPSKFAKKEWEILAEKNLHYVLLTRTKKEFSEISESDFPPPLDKNVDIVKELAFIENKLNDIIFNNNENSANIKKQTNTKIKELVVNTISNNKKNNILNISKLDDKKQKLIKKYNKILLGKTLEEVYDIFNNNGITHNIYTSNNIPNKTKKGDIIVNTINNNINEIIDVY